MEKKEVYKVCGKIVTRAQFTRLIRRHGVSLTGLHTAECNELFSMFLKGESRLCICDERG
jgi:hypothetical protein